MAKRRKTRPPRQPAPRRAAARRTAVPLTLDRIPSAATFFRFKVQDPQTAEIIRTALSALKQVVGLRDRGKVNCIRRAATPEQVLDLVGQATGLAEDVWHQRMNQFGPEVLPLIAARLRTARDTLDGEDLALLFEQYIAALRWRGDAGAEVLLSCFDDLDDYGKSLACVALGLLGAQASADKLWAFYNHVKGNWRELYLVGALWGLTDLQDERASGALVELLVRRRTFYELFGFLSLAGDVRAVGPLLWATTQLPDDDRAQPLMALVSVAHRIGRAALLAEFARVSPHEPPAAREAGADKILSRPASQAEEFFALFYRELTLADVTRVIGGFGP
ncbi:MAG: hypothetical protein KKB13_06265 [Chloroflexi bacterium]|nr:hypothetical protein [Chloroflexota bacterium]